MGWIPVNWHDIILEKLADSDRQVVLRDLPETYLEAYWPDQIWTKRTAFGKGDLITAPLPAPDVYDQNVLDSVFFIYECTKAGTTASNEPVFPTEKGTKFTDGDVEWVTHRNLVLASAPMTKNDFRIVNIETDPISAFTTPENRYVGKKLIVGEKSEITILRNGQAQWVALLDTRTQIITHISKASVPTYGNQSTGTISNPTLLKGNTTTMFSYGIEHRVIWMNS